MKLEELIDENCKCAVCGHEQEEHCAKVGWDSNLMQIHCQSCPPLVLKGFSARHRLVSEKPYIDGHLVEHTALKSCWSAFANKQRQEEISEAKVSSHNLLNWSLCSHSGQRRRRIVEDVIDPKRAKHHLARLQMDTCAGCQQQVPALHFLTIDHIAPKSKGGGDQANNIQLLCHFCNAIKGDRDMDYLKMRLRDKGLLRD